MKVKRENSKNWERHKNLKCVEEEKKSLNREEKRRLDNVCAYLHGVHRHKCTNVCKNVENWYMDGNL